MKRILLGSDRLAVFMCGLPAEGSFFLSRGSLAG